MEEGLLAKFCGCDRAQAPGWAAMDERIVALYGDAKPLHYGTTEPVALGGGDPIEAISAYVADDEAPHWHLLSFGMSELYDKLAPAPDVSGHGFELTMRLPWSEGDEKIPEWSMHVLQALASYVFTTKAPFAPGHYMDFGGALDGGGGAISAVAFVEDPTLGSLVTPNGFMRFLQVVGITADEHEVMMDWDPAGVLDLIARRDRMMVTDVGRRSVLADPAAKAELSARLEREGSTMAGAHGGDLRWEHGDDGVVVTVGAMYVPTLLRGLRRRVPFALDFKLESLERQLLLSPGDAVGIAADERRVELVLPHDAARALADSVRPERGMYRCADVDGLTIVVEPTEIPDESGRIAEVIG
jgi:hypothetical protein